MEGQGGGEAQGVAEKKMLSGDTDQYRATTVRMVMYFCMRVSFEAAMIGFCSDNSRSNDDNGG
jgi:hypothetical protein